VSPHPRGRQLRQQIARKGLFSAGRRPNRAKNKPISSFCRQKIKIEASAHEFA
jgi:hypothetical protein